MSTPPYTPFFYDDVVAGAVVANQVYAQRVKQAWAAKITNSSPKDLEQELFRLGRPDEIRTMLNTIHERLDPTISIHREMGDWPVDPEDKMLVRAMREKLAESNNFGLSQLERVLKLKAQSLGRDDVLELLRLTIMIAILRQLQRQMMGLIG